MLIAIHADQLTGLSPEGPAGVSSEPF
jgi:hypothetical protein